MVPPVADAVGMSACRIDPIAWVKAGVGSPRLKASSPGRAVARVGEQLVGTFGRVGQRF